MLYVNNDYQNWLDYLLINDQSPEQAQQYKWSRDECEKIISASEYLTEAPPYINDEATIDLSFRKVNRWRIPNDQTHSWIYKKICETLLTANKDFWNLDVDLIETVELLHYSFTPGDEFQGHYNKHSDFGGNATTRKLSYSALLSDPDTYDGGDLILYLRTDVTVPKEQGQVVLFPSLTFHEVTPITQGNRWSIVTWIRGRPLR
jgi:PKHD-type hydroxylase